VRIFTYTCACLAVLGRITAVEASSGDDVYRQSREDAWWTGPILAAGASTLPKGHTLVEPYMFNVMSRGRYDDDGTRRSGPRRHSYGSLTYLLYGLVDDFTVGVIPTTSAMDRTARAWASVTSRCRERIG
jgi:hypothetical protein